MATSRILITGTGAVCGSGNSPDSIFAALREGHSSIGPIQMWDTTGWPVKVAAEIADFNPRAMVEDRKLHKFIRRTDMLGFFAGSRAVDRAGFVGHRESLANNVLCHVGIKYNLKGSNACITNHSCGGLLAVIEAAEALRSGEADRAVAIGHDTLIEPQMVLYYHGCGLLAAEAIRPFDSARDGSLFGEGAGALALETEASVRERNATVIGEVLGGGHAGEASGLLAIRDDGDGLVRAMNEALAEARLRPADIGMIVAHGNGTRQSDASEAIALRRVFGSAMPPITAFKWSIHADTLRHRLGGDRAHRAHARGDAGRGAREDFFRAGACRQRQRSGPRRKPRGALRGEGGLREAVSTRACTRIDRARGIRG